MPLPVFRILHAYADSHEQSTLKTIRQYWSRVTIKDYEQLVVTPYSTYDMYGCTTMLLDLISELSSIIG